MALDPERAAELFGGFGPVSVRRMFGGAGVYARGVMFALESGGVIYLKSDASSDDAFEAEACPPFSYMAKGERRVIASYRKAPERLLEDPDEMADWARRALRVAEAAAVAKRAGWKSRRKPAV